MTSGRIPPSRAGRFGFLAALLALLPNLGVVSSAAPSADAPAPAAEQGAPAADPGVPATYLRWLEEVEPLILLQEKKLFLSLRQDYQRDAFIEQFWRVRDPHPRTVRNELKERWPHRLATARGSYGGLRDDRSRILLVHGEPESVYRVRCSATRHPAEVWVYRGTDWLDLDAALLFIQGSPSQPAKLWHPDSGPVMDAELHRLSDCFNGSQVVQVAESLRESRDYPRLLDAFLAKPRPSSVEWVDSFAAFSTEGAVGEPLQDVSMDVAYPGRYQQRTVVQGLVTLERQSAQVGDYGGYRSYDFRLVGEVLHDGQLFESFRYKFGLAADGAPERLALAFQRLLRPGSYRLIVKVEDLASGRSRRLEQDLEVPAPAATIDLPAFRDPETEQLFAEATAALRSGDPSVRLIPPQDQTLLTGQVRFDTLVAGPVAKVRFALDDKVLLTRNAPPFNVEIDLGHFPALRTLSAIGLDAEGREVAHDELLLNSGGYRFLARLREPRRGQRYERSVQARVEVEVPRGRSLDRVELFLNERLVATLYQEPFVQPLVLPTPPLGQTPPPTYVRAVAYLPDGQAAEDLVFIDGADHLEELKVEFVELYASVLGRDGRPLRDLQAGDFTVLEDGERQRLARFEQVENLPIHVGFVIDTSASMVGTLEEVRRAALGFFERTLRPTDRAAIVTFNNFPRMAVELTTDRQALGGGLAGLVAEGRTALYDSVMFALYYFTGVKGQRSLIILSDGKDEASRFSFEQTLDYARRAGITLYPIGLRLAEAPARAQLERLAKETGGTAFFLRDVQEIDTVYAAIEKEMRSQWLLAYQSASNTPDGQFRRIEVKVDRPGAEVKTLSGYYP